MLSPSTSTTPLTEVNIPTLTNDLKITDLPEELFQRILNLLPAATLGTIAPVSRYFSQQTKDDTLWKRVCQEKHCPEKPIDSTYRAHAHNLASQLKDPVVFLSWLMLHHNTFTSHHFFEKEEVQTLIPEENFKNPQSNSLLELIMSEPSFVPQIEDQGNKAIIKIAYTDESKTFAFEINGSVLGVEFIANILVLHLDNDEAFVMNMESKLTNFVSQKSNADDPHLKRGIAMVKSINFQTEKPISSAVISDFSFNIGHRANSGQRYIVKKTFSQLATPPVPLEQNPRCKVLDTSTTQATEQSQDLQSK